MLLRGLSSAQDVNAYIQQLSQHLDSSEQQLKQFSFATKNTKVHNLYININWQNSYAITKSGKVLQFSGRFNALNQAVELNFQEGIRSLQSRAIQLVVIGDNMLIPLPGTLIDLGERPIYFEILSDGEINLLKRFTLAYFMEGMNSLTASYNGEKKYKIIPAYYATSDFRQLHLLKLSKKKVLRTFGERQEEMKAFLKRNKLKLNEEEDLKRLFDQFNGKRNTKR